MKKEMITIEYPLTTKTPGLVWDFISNAVGLQKWIANSVTSCGSKLIFVWGDTWDNKDQKVSTIIKIEQYKMIRLKWDDSDDDDDYWEMKLETSDLTDNLNLVITDFAETDEVDDIKSLWETNLNNLHDVSGL